MVVAIVIAIPGDVIVRAMMFTPTWLDKNIIYVLTVIAAAATAIVKSLDLNQRDQRFQNQQYRYYLVGHAVPSHWI